jgi:hypothetical protein
MADDPLIRLAKLRAISDSADIEAQLSNIQGCRPVLSILVKARNEAAESLFRLFEADPDDGKAIRALQNHVARYYDLLRWLKEIVDKGIEDDQEITGQDREEMIELLSQTEEGRQEAYELGLMERETHGDI